MSDEAYDEFRRLMGDICAMYERDMTATERRVEDLKNKALDSLDDRIKNLTRKDKNDGSV